MEDSPIINNSLKEFSERETLKGLDEKKCCTKKVIIISSSIIGGIVIAGLITFIILVFKWKEREEITCDPGYFLPDDSRECKKCSLEQCRACHGTTESDQCTECFVGFVYKNEICDIDHSIKGIYETYEDEETIRLLHYMYKSNIITLGIDGEKINLTEFNEGQFTFDKKGNHTVYILFDDKLEYLNDIFYQIEHLTEINFTYLFDTSKVTTFHYMFWGCKNLKSINNLHYLNTENVEIMSGMFHSCQSLTSLDLSGFNTQNVTSMLTMFNYCSSLKSLDLSNFNTKKLKSMSSMFEGCYNLTSINLKSFDTKNVYNIDYLFDNCYSLTSIDLSNFNISNVIYMKGIFDNCRSLTSIDISNFINNNDAQMEYMFFGCNSLTYLDISGLHSDDNITIRMFYNESLPKQGKIIVNEDFIELIRNQIPSGWEIVYKNEFI